MPGWYSVAHSLGWLTKDQFWRLRRLGGTCGHPDVKTPGVEANSGSLGMGIAKAKGMAWAKRHGAYALNNAPDYQAAYEHYYGKL